MATINDGGPAFPNPEASQGHYGQPDGYMGMSLRDYFAAAACTGICASKDEAGVLIAHGYEWVAKESLRIADAMLKARPE